MNRKVIIVVSVALILALGYAGMIGLKSLKKQPQKDVNRKKTPFVKVEQVNYQAIATPIVEKGRLLSNLEVNLSSEVPGRIVEVGVPLKVGQRFKKGDLLFHFNGSYHSNYNQGIIWWIDKLQPGLIIKSVATLTRSEWEEMDEEQKKTIANYTIVVADNMTKTNR